MVTVAFWPIFIWVRSVSLKLASTQLSPVSTRLSSGVGLLAGLVT